jgi:hypothetical protein
MPCMTAELSPICGTHFGRDKRGGFDDPNASRGQTVDQFDLDLGRNDLFFVLQTIAWANFDDFDLGGKGHGDGSGVNLEGFG